MGDFYETFDEDAETAARVLGIALTSRPMGAGRGAHPARRGALPPARPLPRPARRRRLPRRDRGADLDAALEGRRAGAGGAARGARGHARDGGRGRAAARARPQLAGRGRARAPAVAGPGAGEAERWGVAACDVTTGELELQLLPRDALAGEWARLDAARAAGPGCSRRGPAAARGRAAHGAARARVPRRPRSGAAGPRLGVASLDGFGLEGLEAAVGAAGALVAYLEESWPQALAHLRAPRAVRGSEVVYLDPQTRRNLELFAPLLPGGARGGGGLAGGDARPHADADGGAAAAPGSGGRCGARRRRRRGWTRWRPSCRRRWRARRCGRAARAAGPGAAARPRARGDGARAAPGAAAAGAGAAAGAAHARRGRARRWRASRRASRASEEAAAAIAAALEDDPPAQPGEGEAPTVRAGFDAEIDRLRGWRPTRAARWRRWSSRSASAPGSAR
jgi:hypothetical protein